MTTTLSITDMTLSEIAKAVATGEVTPNDVLEASLARVAALEDKVQAWTFIDYEGAKAAAQQLTDEAAAGKLRGPLHGVPFGVKDEFDMAGTPTAAAGPGSPIKTVDAGVLTLLKDAGAIILGKTTMPVLGVLPPTRNPWNLEHTAGGTSSGSGAAVGARMVPMAIGEQTAGSNLRPAAYNGVAGMKPSYGRITRFGMYPFTWSRDHVGLIGLTMEDIALVMSVLSGYDPKDPTTMMDPPPSADLKLASVAPPRIGIVRNFFPELTQPEMLEAIEKSAASLKAAGATITDVMLPPEFALTWQAASLVGAEPAAMHAEERAAEAAAGKPVAVNGQRAAELIPATYYVQARRARTWITGKVKELYGDLDALLMAVAPGGAPKGLQSTGNATLLVPWSFLGFPAITINGGLSPEGMPLGLQFVAPPKMDYELMQTGAWCEAVLGRLPAPTVV